MGPKYLSRIHLLLEAEKQGVFNLSSTVISRINDIKEHIAYASLTLPREVGGRLLLETDASG